MDTAEFRRRGREMVDYIADYLETISQRRVTPNVEPGYLRNLIPSQAPKKGEDWDEIMKDVERYIMPGVSTLWKFVKEICITTAILSIVTCSIIRPDIPETRAYIL